MVTASRPRTVGRSCTGTFIQFKSKRGKYNSEEKEEEWIAQATHCASRRPFCGSVRFCACFEGTFADNSVHCALCLVLCALCRVPCCVLCMVTAYPCSSQSVGALLRFYGVFLRMFVTGLCCRCLRICCTVGANSCIATLVFHSCIATMYAGLRDSIPFFGGFIGLFCRCIGLCCRFMGLSGRCIGLFFCMAAAFFSIAFHRM